MRACTRSRLRSLETGITAEFLGEIPMLFQTGQRKPEPFQNEAHSDEPGLWNWNKMEQICG